MTVLVTTHYMDEADQYCDRLALMHKGRIRATGTPESLKRDLAELWQARPPMPMPMPMPVAARTAATPPPSLPGLPIRRSRTCSATSPGANCSAAKEAPTEGVSAMSAVPVTPPPVSAESPPVRPRLLYQPAEVRTGWRVLPTRMAAMCAVEIQKLRHDRTELYTRAVQPALWLLIFGETFTRLHAIPTGGLPVSGLSGAGHHRAVGDVHRDLLRHHDHLGAGLRGADQAAGHADAAGRAGGRQGVRRRGEVGDPGGRGGGAVRAAGGGADVESAEAARGGAGGGAGLGVLLVPVDLASPGSC